MEKRKNKKIIIKISDLSKSFNNNIVLKNINFQLMEGESLAIIGASGSGKSVLLKNIIGILEPDKGSIVINDTEMVNLSRNLKEKLLLDLGITFQHGALFDSLKIWENIIFKVANKEKMLPRNFISKDGYGITKRAIEYLQPLIEGEAYPNYRKGLPRYVELKNIGVQKKLRSNFKL